MIWWINYKFNKAGKNALILLISGSNVSLNLLEFPEQTLLQNRGEEIKQYSMNNCFYLQETTFQIYWNSMSKPEIKAI